MKLALTDLHPSLRDPALTSMNFLNEIAADYPDAISLAAGRPYEEFFDVEDLHRHLRRFCRYLADEHGYGPAQVRRTLFQYGRTKGIITELVARHLAVDEQITADPEAIVVTVGCQEAMALVLRALRAGPADVLLAVAPTYVGLTGAARLVELPVLPVAGGNAGVDLDDLVAVVRRARAAGLRPRACYLMPDFANPSGLSIDLPTRQRLLRVAAEERLLLLEDNPYGLFRADDAPRVPTLKALDTTGQVVYLGSFAKTALPGVRVGYLVADQHVTGAGLFADELSKIKSMLTVNTSPVAQAVVGGHLLAYGCSLTAANRRERAVYAQNLRRLTDGLARRFPPEPDGTRPVSWTVPGGGFFVVVTVPFGVDDALLRRAARDYGVLFTPMHHFYATDPGRPVAALRLSASAVGPAQLDEGLDRLARLVAETRQLTAPT